MKTANDVKKDLLKSKANAKFSHYVSGNMYYTVELEDGKYQFPIPVVEKTTRTFEFDLVDVEVNNALQLSEDLGTTTFSAEMRGSELNRWIGKAIEKEEFIKVG